MIHKKQAKENNSVSGAGVILIGAIFFIAVVGGLLALAYQDQITSPVTQIEKFSSYQSLVAAFEKGQQYNNYGGYYRGGILGDVMAPQMANATAEKSADSSSGATDYSTTNIQVQGVDEADIIKNDGKYVYAISNGKIFIIDAYPAENGKIISTIDLNGANPQELFISKNSEKLMVFANNGGYYAYPMMARGKMAYPYWGGGSSSIVSVYDISNKSSPIIEKKLEFEGSYLNSRLIGDIAYFVINSYPNFYADNNDIIPMMRINGSEEKIAVATDIAIMPRVRPQSFITIGSVNLTNLEMQKETLAGAANNLYSSQDNLYLVDQLWEYGDTNGPIPEELGILAKSIYFPTINQTTKTVINKFNLNDGTITFDSQGIAPGTILNQFSMDEYKDHFRIATTVYSYSEMGESNTKNNLYVYDSAMKMTGAIENIAPNETIYSARFLGDKGYLVTFKQVDPLFVIDLSNPSDPKILGKLKIPGYSDYLHPIDETHILGIGKDVNELEDADKVHTPGAVYYTAIKGIKMAIFDVSDVEHPIELHKVVIGDRGSESEVLNDHKALLFDKSKNLLVLPITIVDNVKSVDSYGEQTFQGAIVFDASIENGFSERGKITHVSSDEELKRGYYYGSESVVRRSLYMDNVLYTFSSKMLKANNLSTLGEISEVAFPQSENSGYTGGYYGPEEPIMID